MNPLIEQSDVDFYRSLFNTRDDVFARYWEDLPSKKSGYAPVYSINQSPHTLTNAVILSHLEGNQTIGVYPLFPDNATAFLAIDFDGPDWLTVTGKLTTIAQENNLHCAVERSKSGNGGHAWFFFIERISGFQARQLGKSLLHSAGITDRRTFDRMFPSQDEHGGKGYGNLICLPLQGNYVTKGNTLFVSPNGEPITDQWQYLRTIHKITPDEINHYLQLQNHSTIQTTKVPANDDNNDETDDVPIATTQGLQTKLILGSTIFIPFVWLPDKLYRYLKKELNFPNPDFYTKERFGYSTWAISRVIKTLEVTPEGILIPLGFLGKLNEFIKKQQLQAEVVDQRVTTKQVCFPSTLTLRESQRKILNQLLKHERVILEAQPGFGKTMVALALMRKRSQKTLIIVHTNTLLHQWHTRLNTYFSLPKDAIGLIGDSKWHIGSSVTIASYMTLSRRGVDEIKNEFGLVIVDECHHVPGSTFSAVVKQFSAKYVLGLTATSFRKDKLEKLMYLYISDHVVMAPREDQSAMQNSGTTVKTELITRKTSFQGGGRSKDFQEICQLIVNDVERNNQIADDIVAAIATSAKCLVLTERLEHCEKILELVRQKTKGVHAAIATGVMTKKQRERIATRIQQERFQLLIATGKLIGEGFDWPAVSHLFLSFPFSWKGKLIQYVGRVQRSYEGKTNAIVHDYFDDQVPMLKIMYFKRLRTYRILGLVKMESPVKKNTVSQDQLSLF